MREMKIVCLHCKKIIAKHLKTCNFCQKKRIKKSHDTGMEMHVQRSLGIYSVLRTVFIQSSKHLTLLFDKSHVDARPKITGNIPKMTVMKSSDHSTLASSKSHGGAYQYITAFKLEAFNAEYVERLTVLLRCSPNVPSFSLTHDVTCQWYN